VLGALGQQAIEQHFVEPLRAGQCVRDALHGILVEVEPGCAESEVEIGDHHVGAQRFRERPRRVVADRRRADATLRSDECEHVTDRIGRRVVVEIGDALHQLNRLNRHDEILADTALQQFAIEDHVVDVADDDDLGAAVAALGKLVEFAQHLAARQARLDDDEIGRRAFLVVRHSCLGSAHVNAHMCFRQAAIFRCLFERARSGRILAEGLDRDARDRPRLGAARFRTVQIVQRRKGSAVRHIFVVQLMSNCFVCHDVLDLTVSL
jgi:hypothetical protein